MIEGTREAAIAAGMIEPERFDEGIAALRRDRPSEIAALLHPEDAAMAAPPAAPQAFHG